MDRQRTSRRLAHDESGQVLALVAVSLVVLIGFTGLVVDVGDWFGTKRKAQGAADAGALAAAQELCEGGDPVGVGEDYVERNAFSEEDGDVVVVTTPYQGNEGKVEVTVDTTEEAFFATLFGIDSVDIDARAVAAGKCTPTGPPLAVYVHELCGNKGLIAGGEDMRIEGGIHVNGNFEVKNPGFVSVGEATVFRPQGGCKTTDQSDSRYCTGCPGGPVNDPQNGAFRDWLTPYHTEAIMKSFTPCNFVWPGDKKYENQAIPNGVHCLGPSAKFEIAGNSSGNITVIAGKIVVGGTGRLAPANQNHPVLFYSTNTAGTEIILNPSQNYDWSGYIINRLGGIKINAAGVTSPLDGLLEAEWVEVNGENFTMLGTFPDSEGGLIAEVSLDE